MRFPPTPPIYWNGATQFLLFLVLVCAVSPRENAGYTDRRGGSGAFRSEQAATPRCVFFFFSTPYFCPTISSDSKPRQASRERDTLAAGLRIFLFYYFPPYLHFRLSLAADTQGILLVTPPETTTSTRDTRAAASSVHRLSSKARIIIGSVLLCGATLEREEEKAKHRESTPPAGSTSPSLLGQDLTTRRAGADNVCGQVLPGRPPHCYC